MGSFHLAGMSLKNLFSKPATLRYPLEKPVYAPMTKGHIENQIELCILCGICEKRCPGTALKVDKAAGTWTIDRFSCVQCNTCVRVCPKKCLQMQTSYTAPATTMSVCTLTKPVEPEEHEELEVSEGV